MTTMSRLIAPAALLLVSASLVGCAKSADALECPKAQAGTGGSVLRETPAEMAQAGQRLGRGSENEIAGTVAAIRARHGSASQGEIVNYLVTAYCPRIAADPALGRAEKQQALQAFAARAYKIAGSR